MRCVMILNNGYRKIKYCVVKEIEVNENLSGSEIDDYIENIAEGKDYVWCDADENLLDMK